MEKNSSSLKKSFETIKQRFDKDEELIRQMRYVIKNKTISKDKTIRRNHVLNELLQLRIEHQALILIFDNINSEDQKLIRFYDKIKRYLNSDVVNIGTPILHRKEVPISSLSHETGSAGKEVDIYELEEYLGVFQKNILMNYANIRMWYENIIGIQ